MNLETERNSVLKLICLKLIFFNMTLSNVLLIINNNYWMRFL